MAVYECKILMADGEYLEYRHRAEDDYNACLDLMRDMVDMDGQLVINKALWALLTRYSWLGGKSMFDVLDIVNTVAMEPVISIRNADTGELIFRTTAI